MSSNNATRELWSQVSYLRGLSSEVYGALEDISTLHRYPADAIIFCEGDADNALYLIVAGTVKISHYSKEGREQILDTFSVGDTFNDVAAMDGGSSPATATSLGEVTLCRVLRTQLRQLATEYPTLAWALIESIAKRTRYLVGLVQDLSLRSVKSRLAKLLLDQANAGDEKVVPRMLTQEEMASRLGTVREVVGRALRSLASAGIIEVDRQSITILDPERLTEEAEL